MPAMIVDSAIYVDGHRAAEPASPDEALDALEEDGVLVEALGAPLVRTHVAVARAQAAMARDLSPEQVAATAAGLY